MNFFSAVAVAFVICSVSYAASASDIDDNYGGIGDAYKNNFKCVPTVLERLSTEYKIERLLKGSRVNVILAASIEEIERCKNLSDETAIENCRREPETRGAHAIFVFFSALLEYDYQHNIYLPVFQELWAKCGPSRSPKPGAPERDYS